MYEFNQNTISNLESYFTDEDLNESGKLMIFLWIL